MVRFLPPQANLDHLKNQAKALHKSHQQAKSEVCPVLRHLHRFADAADEEILSANLTLTEAQFALAMEYGFESWQELRQAVLRLKPSEDYVPGAEGDALILPAPPGGIGGVNRLVAAFSLALSYLAVRTDPVGVAGDSGRAFILQADALHRPFGRNIRQLDIGWWPLDPWGTMLRVDFLSEVYGVPLRPLQVVMSEYKADPALHYRKYHEAQVSSCLQAGRPLIAIERDTYLVVGRDGGNPPLLGQLCCQRTAEVRRLEHFPYVVVVTGDPAEPMDRCQVDAEALDFAVRLGRDEIDLSHLPGKSAGQRSWQLWLAQLEDAGLCGPCFYHANVVGHLRQDRETAVAYLGEMSPRYLPPVGDSLLRAASHYETVLEKLRQADTSEDALSTAEGRGRLASLLREIADIEAKAQGQMAEAVREMR
jgi:hypothetical protein